MDEVHGKPTQVSHGVVPPPMSAPRHIIRPYDAHRPRGRRVSARTRFQRAFARLVATLARAGVERVPGARPAYAMIHRLVFPGGEQRIVVNGMPMWVDTRDRVIATHLLGDEIWEPSETAAFLAQAREGMCVFDVGANIGYYTLLAARAVGSSGRVYAFEPEPVNFLLLTRNVAENRLTNVRLVDAAVSNPWVSCDCTSTTRTSGPIPSSQAPSAPRPAARWRSKQSPSTALSTTRGLSKRVSS